MRTKSQEILKKRELKYKRLLENAKNDLERDCINNNWFLGNRIAELIRSKGYTETTFATKMRKRQSDVYSYCSGFRNLTISTLSQIAFHLDMRVSDIYCDIIISFTEEELLSGIFPKHYEIKKYKDDSYKCVSEIGMSDKDYEKLFKDLDKALGKKFGGTMQLLDFNKNPIGNKEIYIELKSNQ